MRGLRMARGEGAAGVSGGGAGRGSRSGRPSHCGAWGAVRGNDTGRFGSWEFGPWHPAGAFCQSQTSLPKREDDHENVQRAAGQGGRLALPHLALPEGPSRISRNGPCRRRAPARQLKVFLIETGTVKEEFKRSQSLPSPGLAAGSGMILINTTSFPQT